MNDLANVSASACLVGQLCSILHVLDSSSAHYLSVAFSCLLGLCVLCVSSCESVVQPLLKSEQLGLFCWPVGLSSAVWMLILLPLQFVALVMRQWAATKGFSHSNYMGILDLCAASVLIGLVTETYPGSKWSTCIPKLWSVIVGNGRKTYLKSFSVLDGVSDMKKCWWQCHRKPLTSGRRQPDSSQRYLTSRTWE